MPGDCGVCQAEGGNDLGDAAALGAGEDLDGERDGDGEGCRSNRQHGEWRGRGDGDRDLPGGVRGPGEQGGGEGDKVRAGPEDDPSQPEAGRQKRHAVQLAQTLHGEIESSMGRLHASGAWDTTKPRLFGTEVRRLEVWR